MTWYARSSSDGGIVRPRALAVLRLTTNRNRSACSTGRSAGSSPFRTFLKKDGSLQLRTVGVEVQCRLYKHPVCLAGRPPGAGGGWRRSAASFTGSTAYWWTTRPPRPWKNSPTSRASAGSKTSTVTADSLVGRATAQKSRALPHCQARCAPGVTCTILPMVARTVLQMH